MKRKVLEGVIDGNLKGYGFLIPDEGDTDYFIPHGELKGAMHGDRVLCECVESFGERTTARVLKILERGITQLVGTYFTCRSGGFVTPDERKYFTDIFIPFGKGVRAKAGDKVVCRILAYPKKKNPEGIVSSVLGRQFDKKAELKSILFNYKLPEKFPKKVLEEADSFPETLFQSDYDGRADFRKDVVFTVDGEDARDFDDAISVKKIRGGYELGVHIADVSHYVTDGSFLNKEAYFRATSVYFPESVIPMLPERLCNGLCSLREGVDRLTLSCVMKIDEDGKVKDSKILPSVIRSSARLTYAAVQKILDGDKVLAKKYSKQYKSIVLADRLADVLYKKRVEKGSIDLEVKESAITVVNGEIDVRPTERDKAHGLIEEFMISANCAVAEYMFYLGLPFIYRVHGKPTEERLEKFYGFLSGLGISQKRSKEGVFPKDFQSVLEKTQNTPFFTVINRVMLRTMQKAKYSPDDVGHFGLGKAHYCHFTSPIRRYPDLVVHRILKDLIKNGSEGLEEKYGQFVADASEQSSVKEKNAEEAERAVDDYYKILYISGFNGEEFDGVISGVTSFGVFVELENGVEGLCKIDGLKGGRYKYDEKNFTLSNGKRCYKLGQNVRICVLGVNISERRAEFSIID